ncbi:DUF465 domain-containing protein [Pseudodesulfovibrio sp. F-1]|uniref:DUF465 domain-containing protein n=1 Tax=Pseudodesulfovibrio alkaliphilus TaxID=2661613 RepID=A0A7K1KR87_9BACT|nr:DUF465 domain-containing protein [Pseudodesulfovibrio alkaliphilus]MUM78371.1 DUF465 domain-containing protein [Pseudodesulfovibrio alkaliphilus]
MEAKDLELIEMYGAEDPELMALWEQHVVYEKMLDKMEAKSFLSPTEAQEVKELKKKKLAGKTKMQSLLDKYRTLEA